MKQMGEGKKGRDRKQAVSVKIKKKYDFPSTGRGD